MQYLNAEDIENLYLDVFGAPAERNIVDEKGLVLNPSTGNLVKADGRVGRALIREHERRLEEKGATIPKGLIGRRVGLKAPMLGPPSKLHGSRKVGAFTIRRFGTARPGGAKTVADFAKDIAKTQAGIKGARQVIITMEDSKGEQIRRTIHGTSAADFANAINRIQSKGAVAGSDTIDDSYTLNTSEFEVGGVDIPAGGALKFTGISKAAGRQHPHFKLMEFSGKASPGDCLFAVLRAVSSAAGNAKIGERNGTIRARLGIPAAPASVVAESAVIDKIAKVFSLRVRVITGMGVPPEAERTYDDCPTRLIGRNLCTTIAEPVVIACGGDDDATPCDVYLADDHYEYLAKILEPVRTCPVTGDILKVGAMRDSNILRRRVIQQGRTWHAEAPPAEERPVAEKIKYKELIIVYDYETYYLYDGELEPYALGYIVFDPATRGDDFSTASGEVTQVIRKAGDTKKHVSAPLLDLLAAAPIDTRYTLVSFNGARFDHFLLANAANNRGVLTSVFATAGGGLRSLNIGRHSTLDLAKLIPAMSLSTACKGFQTRPTKQEGFSHVVIQKAYEEGRLHEWLEHHREELSDYLARDVLSEASLFMKINKSLPNLTGQAIYGPKACQTIGGHAWAFMEKKCRLPKPVSDPKQDELIRGAIVGGRVQVYYGPDQDETKPAPPIDEGELHMVDFASLYPTAMAAVDKAASVFRPEELWGVYPAGETNGEPEEVDEFIAGKVGLYEITVHEQPPGLPNVLPRRGETLEWSFRGEFKTWATHIDINLIRNSGGRLTVHRGLVWPVAVRGLFLEFIRPLAAMKDQQDVWDKAGDKQFNPAMRMAVKLLMNSASGKCCQRNYDDVVVLASGASAQLAAERKMDQDKPRTWIPIGGETCIIVGKKPQGSIYKKTAKPSILAVLIYSYSRALVWRTLCQHNVLYSDTDSGLFRPADYAALRAAFPQMDPTGRKKELGDLESELKPHARAVAYRVAPKDYGVFLYDSDGKMMNKDCKIRIKGVAQHKDRLISPESLAELKTLDIPEYTQAYYEESTERSTPLSDPNMAKEFLKRRTEGGVCHVLSSQIVRSFKDDMKPLSLTQRYLIKTM